MVILQNWTFVILNIFFFRFLPKKENTSLCCYVTTHKVWCSFCADNPQTTKSFVSIKCITAKLDLVYLNWCEEPTLGFKEGTVKGKKYIVVRVIFVWTAKTSKKEKCSHATGSCCNEVEENRSKIWGEYCFEFRR